MSVPSRFRRSHGLVTLGVLGVAASAFVACQGERTPEGPGEGMAFRIGVGDICGVESYDVLVWQDLDGDNAYDVGEEIVSANVAPSDYADVGGLDLPAGATGEDGYFLIADQFFALPAGTYNVTVTALGSALEIVPPNDTQTMTGIDVTAGGTTEIAFVFSCAGDSIGGLDVIILVNEGPSLTDFDYGTDKFGMLCENMGMTATYSDEAESLDMHWELRGPFLIAGNGPPSQAEFDGGALVNQFDETVSAPAPGADITASWDPPCPGDGTYWVQVTATDPNGQETSFLAPLHCFTPAYGLCLTDAATTLVQWSAVGKPLAGSEKGPTGTVSVDAWPTIDTTIGGTAAAPTITFGTTPGGPAVAGHTIVGQVSGFAHPVWFAMANPTTFNLTATGIPLGWKADLSGTTTILVDEFGATLDPGSLFDSFSLTIIPGSPALLSNGQLDLNAADFTIAGIQYGWSAPDQGLVRMTTVQTYADSGTAAAGCIAVDDECAFDLTGGDMPPCDCPPEG